MQFLFSSLKWCFGTVKTLVVSSVQFVGGRFGAVPPSLPVVVFRHCKDLRGLFSAIPLYLFVVVLEYFFTEYVLGRSDFSVSQALVLPWPVQGFSGTATTLAGKSFHVARDDLTGAFFLSPRV